MNKSNNDKKFEGYKDEKMAIGNDKNHSLNIYYKKGKISHERNMTNYQLNNKNYEDEDLMNEIKDLRERENKINSLKEELYNINKLETNLRIKNTNIKKGLHLSEPNLEIIKKQKAISDNKINNQFNFDETDKASQKELINNLNDNILYNEFDNNNFQNNISENKEEKMDINRNNKDEKNYGQIKKIKNINNFSKNKFTFNKIESSHKIENKNKNEKKINNGIFDKLKVENINLKVKNGLLKTSLDKKDKIIEALNNKIKELENMKKNNNNTNGDLLNENNKKEIDDLKVKNIELLKKNEILTSGIESLNDRIKDINLILEKKNKKFKNEITSYKTKLSEYRRKIILLKRKINELYKNNIYLNSDKTPFGSLNVNDNYRFPKSCILNTNNILNKNQIFEDDWKNFRNNEDLFDDKARFSHHRYNTYVYEYKNYLKNI